VPIGTTGDQLLLFQQFQGRHLLIAVGLYASTNIRDEIMSLLNIVDEKRVVIKEMKAKEFLVDYLNFELIQDYFDGDDTESF
jgi:hypothetical protein